METFCRFFLFEVKHFPDAAGRIEQAKQKRVVAVSMKRALGGREEAHIGALGKAPMVAERLQKRGNLLMRRHIPGGRGRIPDLTLAQRIAVDQVVTGTPLEKGFGGDRVVLERTGSQSLLLPTDNAR